MSLLWEFWPYLLAAGGFVAAIVAAWFDGGKRVKAKQLAEEAKARDISDQVDNDVGALPPGAAKEGLNKWSRR